MIGLGTHQRRVGELLANETAKGTLRADWPTLHVSLSSSIRQREVAAAVLDLQRSWLGHDEIVTHATALSIGDRWSELARFTERYTQWLDSLGEIDPARLLVDAGLALRAPGVAASYRRHCPHLLFDDFERADFAVNRLLTMFASPTRATEGSVEGSFVEGSVVVSGDPNGARWRRPDGPLPFASVARRLGANQTFTLAASEPDLDVPTLLRRTLALAHHRSLEADAVVAAILDAHAGGTAWQDIAVVLPPVGQPAFTAALHRVARRLSVPLAVPITAGDDPTVRAFADLVAWVSDRDPDRLTMPCSMGWFSGPHDARLAALPRTEPTATATAVRALWAVLGPWFVTHADGDTLDVVSAFVQQAGAPGADIASGLEAHVTASDGQVAVIVPRDIAGRSWAVVVVTRCVDGVWPPRGASEAFFDTALLNGPDVAEGPERSRLDAQEWARRFAEVAGCATREVVAVAAPEPGVLVSRFVEGWEPRPVVLHQPAAAPQTARTAPSPGAAPAFPTRRLRLSATQLDTYENCPLNYMYQYVAGIRGEGSVSANVGSIVHAALESFLLGDDRSLDALLATLDGHWDPTAFAYRPQEADYRSRAEGWLRRWWADELPRITEVIAVEHRFTIEVGDHELTGSIDRVSRDADGRLEIVDYKTGSAPRGKIDETNLQLATYHLAAVRDPVIAAHGPPERLRLHYLDGGGSAPGPHAGKDIEQPITADHIEKTEARILLTAQAILDEHFEPSVDANCDYCSFHRLCPLQPEGREVVEAARWVEP